MESDSVADSPIAGVRPWPRWQLFAFRYVLLHHSLYAFPGPIRSLVQTVTGGLELAGINISQAPWSWPSAP